MADGVRTITESEYQQLISAAPPKRTITESEYAALTQQADNNTYPNESDSMLSAAWKGIKGVPGAIAGIPSGIASLFENAGAAVTGDLGAAETTARGVGTAASGLAGGLTGAKLGAGVGSLGGPIGTLAGGVIGGGLGYGAGLLGFNKANQVAAKIALGKDEFTSPRQDRNQFVYDATQGMAGDVIMRGAGKVASGAVSKAQDFIEPMTEGGRQARSARILREMAGDPDLAPRLENMTTAGDELAGVKSTAEILDSPQLAQAQKTMARTSPEVAGLADDFAKIREEARNRVLGRVSKATEADALGSGQTIRAKAQGIREKAGQAVSEAYGNIDQSQTLPVKPLQESTIASLDDFFGSEMAPPMDPTIARITEKLFNSSDEISVKGLNDMRQQLQEAKSTLFRAGGSKGNANALLADRLVAAIDDLEANAGTGLKEAIDLRRGVGKKLDQGLPGSITKQGRFGEFSMKESTIPEAALKTPEGAQQFVRAYGKSKAAMGAMQDYIAGKMRELTPARQIEWFRTRKPALRALLGNKFAALESVINDMKSEAKVGKMADRASRGQSATAQIFSQKEAIDSLFADRSSQIGDTVKAAVASGIGASMGSPMIGGIIGGVVGGGALRARDAFFNPRFGQVRSNVYEALMSPAKAKELLKAKPSGMEKLGAAVGKAQKAVTGGGFLSALPLSRLGEVSQRRRMEDVKAPKVEQQDISAIVEKTAGSPEMAKLAKAVIRVESNGDPRAQSGRGAQGLMQIMPAMQKSLGVKDPFDPADNIRGGVALLKEEIKRFGGNLELALAAYNAGSPKVKAAIAKAGSMDWEEVAKYLPEETRNYVPKVKKYIEV